MPRKNKPTPSKISSKEYDKQLFFANTMVMNQIEKLPIDPSIKVFLKNRVNARGGFLVRGNIEQLRAYWNPYNAAFRSMPPDALLTSDIDRQLLVAVRDINESVWVATEWCCAGHKKHALRSGNIQGYLTLMVREEDLGALMTIIQKVRDMSEPGSKLYINTEMLSMVPHADLGPKFGLHRCKLEVFTSKWDEILLWRKYCRRLGKAIRAEGQKRDLC